MFMGLSFIEKKEEEKNESDSCWYEKSKWISCDRKRG